MIRPLAYCESINHFEHSIETIDSRIQELMDLRQHYVAGRKALENAESREKISFLQETDSAQPLAIMNNISLQQ